jgi:AcrR family transcriptional regulator
MGSSTHLAAGERRVRPSPGGTMRLMTASPPAAKRRPPAPRGSGEALRAQILEATSEMLAETGDPSQVSLRAVARRVGIATTSIYLHFADLGELLLAVKRQRFAEFTALIEAAGEGIADPRRRLKARGRAYATFGMEHPGHYRVMFTTAIGDLLTEQPERFPGFESLDIVRLDVAEALGLEPDSAEVLMTATHLWTGMHGTVTLRAIQRTFVWPDLTTEIDDFADRILGLPRG